MDVQAACAKLKTLPPGHYEIKEIRKRLNREYSACEALERPYYRKIRHSLSAERAQWLAGQLAVFFNIRPLRRIVLNSPEAKHIGGCYMMGEIHLPFEYINTMTFLHEFAHHVAWSERCSDGHGPNFCAMFELTLMAAENLLK